jgi:hypothetical protein
MQVNWAHSKYMPFPAFKDSDYGKPELFTPKSAYSGMAGVPAV